MATTTASAGDTTFSILTPMPSFSILNNPTANTSSSSFSDSSNFPLNPSLDSLSSANGGSDSTLSSTEVIIEALRSKDRLFVLKLGEQMESLILERKTRIDLNPVTSYQRLLVHRCSAYYKLSPENDPLSKGIIVYSTVESKIPSRRISELVPAEETAQPAFKIMRRNFQDRNRVRPQPSQAGSVVGDDADLSDVDPSETGSQGGRSNATGSSKKFMTIEEREAAYNKARSRIFMDFEEKEKAKEKDMSASSSTFSLVSGSASTSAGRDSGSVGDIDDSISTVATESEWSGPATREKVRRSGSGNNSTGSSRSLRSFNTNGGSSRDSRAPSPSFSYASLYEAPPAVYEAPQYFNPPPVGYATPYMYSYPPPPPGQAQGQHMMPPYPYYPPYPYHHPQQHPHSDPTSPAGGEGMFSPPPHPHSMSYPPPYMWPHGHPPPPPQHPQSAPPQPHHPPPTPGTPANHPQANYSAPPYMHPASPYGPYPIPFYPPHPPGAQGPPSHFQSQPVYNHDPHLITTSHSMNGQEPSQGRRSNSGGGNNSRRSAPKVRQAWSYGPGTSTSSYPIGNGETIGPRLTSAMRRQSGHSSAGSGGNRTPGDEASSTASSSTTSSSSRRTYTSTTSSKHPLPPRPDWAVGLKAQPTLSQHRSHDQSSTGSLSPPGSNGIQSQPNLHPVVFQSADFPPLSNMPSPPEKRVPTVAGVWNNLATKSIITPALNGHSQASALVHYPNGQEGYERPPSKGNGELFNPKVMKRHNNGGPFRGDPAIEAALLDKMESLGLTGGSASETGLNAMAVGESPQLPREKRRNSLER